MCCLFVHLFEKGSHHVALTSLKLLNFGKARLEGKTDLRITLKPHSPAWDLLSTSLCLDSGLLFRRRCNSPRGKQEGRGDMERYYTVYFSTKSPPSQSCFCRQSSGMANSGMPPGLHDNGTSLLTMVTLSCVHP